MYSQLFPTPIKILLLTLFILLGYISSGNDDEEVTLGNVSGSTLLIEGDSTLHSWDAEAEEFAVTFTVNESWLESSDNWTSDTVEKLKVVVEVEDLESGRSRMNSDLREALRADDYPEIVFEWKEISVDENSGSYVLDVTGSLEIAGEEREVEFKADAELKNGAIEVEGSYELNMEDYGVDPPTAMLGSLRTDKMVMIKFDLVLGERDD